jgi:hypothetical protein
LTWPRQTASVAARQGFYLLLPCPNYQGQ